MKLIWSRNLYIQNPWEPKFRGVFSHCKSDISFYYMDGSTVMMVCGCVGNPIALTGKTNGLKIPLPRYWAIVEAKKERYLMCGDGIAINLEKNIPIAPASEDLRNIYQKYLVSSKHFVEDPFVFGEYQISHQQEWGYSCKKDGIEIWKFSVRAYLHTEIFKISDQIYFGTAGLGGYFYILNINTGNPILKLRTGGTTVIKQCGDYVYLYTDVGRKKSGLACVNLSDGKILEDIELPGAASIDSGLEVYENKAYTITFQYKNNAVEHAVLSCILLN